MSEFRAHNQASMTSNSSSSGSSGKDYLPNGGRDPGAPGATSHSEGPPQAYEEEEQGDGRKDGSASTQSSCSGDGGAAQEDGDDQKAGGSTVNHARLMQRSRMLIYVILVVLGAICAVATYMFSAREESKDGRDQAKTLSVEIATTVTSRLAAIVKSFQFTANVFSVYATQKGVTSASQFMTLPYFEGLVQDARETTNMAAMIFAPTISSSSSTTEEATDHKTSWEDYSLANHQSWMQQSSDTLNLKLDASTLTIKEHIFDFPPANSTSSRATAYGKETTMDPPYSPVWQVSPFNVPSTSDAVPLINGNLQSHHLFASAYAYASSSNNFVISKSDLIEDDNSGLVDAIFGVTATDDSGPFAIFVQPIVIANSNNDDDGSTNNVQGSLVGVLKWEDFFHETFLHDNIHDDMIVSLSNTCGQNFNFHLLGTKATYSGTETLDSADPNQDYVITEVLLDSTTSATPSLFSFCEYSITVHPTDDLLSSHRSDHPWQYALAIVGIFAVAAVVFLLYDTRVQYQRSKTLQEEKRRNDLVESLFPNEGRKAVITKHHRSNRQRHHDKLHEKQDSAHDDGHSNTSVPSQQKGNDAIASKLGHEDGIPNGDAVHDDKHKVWLESAIDPSNVDDEDDDDDFEASTSNYGHAISKPIADLFPNTTVLFADIAGFTAWSSVREPSQVFTLLETVYRGFDRSAQRRDVFKVETVGDCYVAVSGLPEPNKNHARIMCEFARDCVALFTHLVSRLEVILGPDTGDLGIRVGVHSGPVTAGVLRGNNSRFQLFGDTVNTAARIETTGSRNRIHISHDTAELLHSDGKSHWVRKRTDTVVAKGKGELQTFWLLTESELAASSSLPKDADGSALTSAPLPLVKAIQPRLAKASATELANGNAELPPKVKRLVDWNVDVLKRLLQKIQAQRIAKGTSSGGEYSTHQRKLGMVHVERDVSLNNFVLDEVQEIIMLPRFDQTARYDGNPNKIVLPTEVLNQLRLFVSSVALMHRENPFHNFEHASHVMMSVSKLLSRIIAPTEIDNQEAATLHDHTYGITSDPLTQFAVVLAALVHDVDHSGVSNFQLIKENSKVANVFKNKSVAEQNAIVIAWSCLMQPRFMALRKYIYSDADDLLRFRALMVNTVLATDIFDKELQTLRRNRWHKAFADDDAITDSESNKRNRKATIVIEHLIQASDVAHTMQHWHVYQKWNERLFDEMMVAFKSGRMDSNPAENWYQGELKFFDSYIIPLAKKLKECGVFGVSSDEYLRYALENRREWESKGEEIVAKMVEKCNEIEEAQKQE